MTTQKKTVGTQLNESIHCSFYYFLEDIIAFEIFSISSSVIPVNVGKFIPVDPKRSVTGNSSPRRRDSSRKGGNLCSGIKKGLVSIPCSPNVDINSSLEQPYSFSSTVMQNNQCVGFAQLAI